MMNDTELMSGLDEQHVPVIAHRRGEQGSDRGRANAALAGAHDDDGRAWLGPRRRPATRDHKLPNGGELGAHAAIARLERGVPLPSVVMMRRAERRSSGMA